MLVANPRHDKQEDRAYINVMRKLLLLIPLFGLLALALWFAASSWQHVTANIPPFGYLAIAGGVFFSALIGGGLMALTFYSSRHGYDDLSGGDGAADESEASWHRTDEH